MDAETQPGRSPRHRRRQGHAFQPGRATCPALGPLGGTSSTAGLVGLGGDTEQLVDLLLGQRPRAGGRRDHEVADQLDLRLEVVVGEVLTGGVVGRHTTNLGPRRTRRETNPGSSSGCAPTARQVIMCSCPRYCAPAAPRTRRPAVALSTATGRCRRPAALSDTHGMTDAGGPARHEDGAFTLGTCGAAAGRSGAPRAGRRGA